MRVKYPANSIPLSDIADPGILTPFVLELGDADPTDVEDRWVLFHGVALQSWTVRHGARSEGCQRFEPMELEHLNLFLDLDDRNTASIVDRLLCTAPIFPNSYPNIPDYALLHVDTRRKLSWSFLIVEHNPLTDFPPGDAIGINFAGDHSIDRITQSKIRGVTVPPPHADNLQAFRKALFLNFFERKP